MSEQLTLDEAPRVQVRPVDTVRAALLNAKPTPVHRGDPETATLASIAAAIRASALRQRVLMELDSAGSYGCTDYELSVALDCLRTTSGKRRHELMRAGLCKRTDQRRLTDTATTAVVHRITDLGQQVAENLRAQGDLGGTEQLPTRGGLDPEASEEGGG